MSMNFNGSFSPNVFPIVVGASQIGAESTNYFSAPISMDNFGSFGSGFTHLDAGEVSSINGSNELVLPPTALCEADIPTAQRAGIIGVNLRVRTGNPAPSTNDFFYVFLKKTTGGAELLSWGGGFGPLDYSSAKISGTPGSITVTTPAYTITPGIVFAGVTIGISIRIIPSATNFQCEIIGSNTSMSTPRRTTEVTAGSEWLANQAIVSPQKVLFYVSGASTYYVEAMSFVYGGQLFYGS